MEGTTSFLPFDAVFAILDIPGTNGSSIMIDGLLRNQIQRVWHMDVCRQITYLDFVLDPATVNGIRKGNDLA